MRSPGPGAAAPRHAARGFTLIEVLVVVAITGIILAVAAVNFFPGDAEVARRESGLMALAIERARDTAWFGGRPAAISFDEGRMREWRLQGDSWQPDPARDQALGGDVQILGLYVDGQRLERGERLVFFADGLGIPFRVALQIRGLAWAIEGDAAGSIALVKG
jgi:general secretion pathway protein H